MDYGQSKVCSEKKTCSLADQPNTVNIVQDKEPGITGPLRVGTGASDGFMLQYYEGYPLKDVAWGQITDEKQWQQLEEIKISIMRLYLARRQSPRMQRRL